MNTITMFLFGVAKLAAALVGAAFGFFFGKIEDDLREANGEDEEQYRRDLRAAQVRKFFGDDSK